MGTETVNLGELGIGFRELGELAEMLTQLADKGELYGQKFDLDSLQIGYNHICRKSSYLMMKAI